MTNQDQTDAMADILGKMNAAAKSGTYKKEAGADEASAMEDVLKRLQEATGAYSDKVVTESRKKPEIGVALNAQRTESGVSVSRYDIRTEKRNVQEGFKKTFYYIVDNKTGDMVQDELGLFESAMGIVKHTLYTQDDAKVQRILDLDQEYVSVMMETYRYKRKLKQLNESSVQYDVTAAKYSNSKTRLSAAKMKLLKAL